jgi:circadian clock protein KaiC
VSRTKGKTKSVAGVFPKSPTGIKGLDEITGGGLPGGRPTLVCGSAGCGKTLMAMEFLVRGATRYDEPGVFVAFEETAEELTQNVASLGFDLGDLIAREKLYIDHVHIERSEIEETGEFDLDGLFVRLAYAIDSIGAKRLVLDTLEALFALLPNEMILRAELRRLFRWLKGKGVTAVITAERGDGTLTRHGLEEYVSDCVILLDHRVAEQVSTRRLRVVKYRGSLHGTNEYPILIDEHGIVVLPITSIGLNNKASTQRIPSGIPRLDAMLGGKGFYRGSSILVSGTAGTGKTSLAAHFANAACERGERCLYFAFEESMSQIIRNMRSIGIDLQRRVRNGLLRFHAERPTAYGLETHLATMHNLVDEFKPSVAIVDPITNLTSVGETGEVHAALMRLIDFLKTKQVTCLLTSLTEAGTGLEHTTVGISSLMDTWIVLSDIESSGERNRGIYVLKSRGMAHSTQIREFRLTSRGVQLTDVYLGPAGVLTGAARTAQEAKEKADAIERQQELERKQRDLERQRQTLEAQVAALHAEFEAEEEELKKKIAREQQREQSLVKERTRMAGIRKADDTSPLATAPRKMGRHRTVNDNGKRRLK